MSSKDKAPPVPTVVVPSAISRGVAVHAAIERDFFERQLDQVRNDLAPREPLFAALVQVVVRRLERDIIECVVVHGIGLAAESEISRMIARLLERDGYRWVRAQVALEENYCGLVMHACVETGNTGTTVALQISREVLATRRRDRRFSNAITPADLRRLSTSDERVGWYDRDERARRDAYALLPPVAVDLRRQAAVNILVRICRVIANAQALRMAAACSLRPVWWTGSHQVPGARFAGVCARHGYLLSNDWLRAGVPDACPHCDRVRGSVALLVGIVRGALAAWAKAREDAIDGLVSVIRQAGAVLWEQQDDGRKRALLLETDAGPRVAAPAEEPDERWALLEVRDQPITPAPATRYAERTERASATGVLGLMGVL